MKVLLNVPYYTGSHKYWADNLIQYSKYDFDLIAMNGRHWKWRLQGSAIHLANQFNQKYRDSALPHLIICSTMMDVSLYRSLIRKSIPIVYFMHENQLTYPVSDIDERREEFHYGFINYKSCLAADYVFFNSAYHRTVFLEALEKLLKRLPDYQSMDSIKMIQEKSEISWIGIDLDRISEQLIKIRSKKQRNDIPVILWNHRWEHDKNPDLFRRLLLHLDSKGIDFKLVLTGESSEKSQVFQEINSLFRTKIAHSGFFPDYKSYIEAISHCDLSPISSEQDFYGISVLEAVCCGVSPLLPQNRVYNDFLPEADHPYLYYSSESEFFRKAALQLQSYEFEILENPILKLQKHSIHNVVSEFDLHMNEILNI